MKRISFLIAVCMILTAGSGCNDSGSAGNEQNKDTTLQAHDTIQNAGDTIKSDPSKFSDPH